MNQRGNRTPPRLATARVITTGSVTRPRNALGNPSSEDCQEVATVPQLITALMLQPRSALGFAASLSASMDSTNDATRLATEAISIVTQTVTLWCRSRCSHGAVAARQRAVEGGGHWSAAADSIALVSGPAV